MSTQKNGPRAAFRMTFTDFCKNAVFTELQNHGRKWEASLDGVSLGFADGSIWAARRQVHKREINNAVYWNAPANAGSITSDMPTAGVLANHPDIIRRFADLFVGKANPCVSLGPLVSLTRDEFNQYIIACFAEIAPRLEALVQLPLGHSWGTSSDLLAWFSGDPLESTKSGMAFPVNLTVAEDKNATQISIEVRYFWQERILVDDDPSRPVGKPQHTAHLWVEQGRLYWGMHETLLGSDEVHVYADTIEELSQKIAVIVNGALARANPIVLAEVKEAEVACI